MKSRLILLPAIGLIAVGALADHIVTNNFSGPSAVAATSTPSTGTSSSNTTPAVMTSNVTTTLIDAATEGAYAAASVSVVYVSNVGVGSGSGVIYDSNGDIVTNNHVIDGASKLTVTLNNGRVYPATLVGTDKADDLAIIRIHAPNLVPAHFAAPGTYHVAQTVLAIGSPLGLKQSVTSGLISGIHRVEQEQNGAYLPDAIQTSAPINPGNSGGAIVTLSGTVVGIPTLVQTTSNAGTATQNIGFAIPSERVVLIAKQVIATGKVEHTGRAYLGISPSDSSSQSPSLFNGGFDPNGTTPSVAGAIVQQVSPSGPAGQAGVQQGDVITALDGKTVSSADDLLALLAQKTPGDKVTVTVNRNGTSLSKQVQLGEMPA